MKSNEEIINNYINNANSRLIHCKLPGELLPIISEFDYKDEVSRLLDLTTQIDLNQVDEKIKKGLVLRKYTDVDGVKGLRALLKLGFLIDDIRKTGQQNPVQLILGPVQYLMHPGTTRNLIFSYVEPPVQVSCLYCWDPVLDPDPVFLHYAPEWEFIRDAEHLISLHKSYKNYTAYHTVLTHNTPIEGTWELMLRGLHKRFGEFNTEMFTLDDQWGRDELSNKFFSDYISINEDVITISGINFKKENQHWEII